jgi:hypothetical protein
MPMSTAAADLEIYIDNDRDLYRQMTTMILKNLAARRAKGEYDHAKAVRAFMYLADAGARKYTKEHGSPGTPWHKTFTVADRRQAAESLAHAFEAEAALGNYDHLVPAAVAGRRAKAPAAGRSGRTPAQLKRDIVGAVGAVGAAGRR